LSGKDLFNQIRAEVVRLSPAEIILPESLEMENDLPGHISRWQDYRFELSRCKEALLTHFKAASLDGFGLNGMTEAICAAGVIIQYISEMQPEALPLLSSLSTYQLSEFIGVGCCHQTKSGTHRNHPGWKTRRFSFEDIGLHHNTHGSPFDPQLDQLSTFKYRFNSGTAKKCCLFVENGLSGQSSLHLKKRLRISNGSSIKSFRVMPNPVKWSLFVRP